MQAVWSNPSQWARSSRTTLSRHSWWDIVFFPPLSYSYPLYSSPSENSVFITVWPEMTKHSHCGWASLNSADVLAMTNEANTPTYFQNQPYSWSPCKRPSHVVGTFMCYSQCTHLNYIELASFSLVTLRTTDKWGYTGISQNQAWDGWQGDFTVFWELEHHFLMDWENSDPCQFDLGVNLGTSSYIIGDAYHQHHPRQFWVGFRWWF